MSVPEFASRPQLSDDVARYIRQRIFDGTYRGGQYLRLEQLAAELGVSITPVREALFNLRADGLLAQQPRRGFTVVPVTARDITDVATVQAFVGGELAARAAENISDEQVTELRDAQRALEEAYASGDTERAVRLNHEFHRGINVAADSPKLTQLMVGVTRYAPESVFPVVHGWADKSSRHHRKIIAALARRDPDKARAAMAEHLSVGVTSLIEHLVAQGVIDS